MVYASLTFTAMHDLMITISLVFLLVAALALLYNLYLNREAWLLVLGCASLLVLIASATIYFSEQYTVVLPWGQRASFALLAIWLVALDFILPRSPVKM